MKCYLCGERHIRLKTSTGAWRILCPEHPKNYVISTHATLALAFWEQRQITKQNKARGAQGFESDVSLSEAGHRVYEFLVHRYNDLKAGRFKWPKPSDDNNPTLGKILHIRKYWTPPSPETAAKYCE